MKYELPKLPYAYNALEPYLDEQTMIIHHTKHHQAYVDNLNKAVENHPELQKMKPEDLLKDLSKIPEDIRTAVRNNGGGVVNHSFFWQIMAPKAGGVPSGKIGEAINKTFNSFDKFKEEFTNAGLRRFGSGWAWLVVENGKLLVMSTANQDTPLSEGKTPILAVDVWEHSYYILYKWQRAEYLKNWWNVVNWRIVDENYQKALKLSF